MAQYRLRLSGAELKGVRVSGPLLRDLLGALVDSVRQAVRLRVEGRSSAPGKVPAWLEPASEFDLVQLEEGSTQIVLEARSLSSVVPRLFGQTDMFAPSDPKRTCLDFFAESLADALSGREDSDLYDDGLIKAMEAFEPVFSRGVNRVDWISECRLEMTAESIATFRQLRRAIPREQEVVVAGKIDLLRHSDGVFTLLTESGVELRGIVASSEIDLDELRGLWGRPARVSGLAKFRPSGAVLRIDAGRLQPATKDDLSLWSNVPRPVLGEMDERSLHKPQGPKSGMPAIVGQWPGDETDEEILAALDELS